MSNSKAIVDVKVKYDSRIENCIWNGKKTSRENKEMLIFRIFFFSHNAIYLLIYHLNAFIFQSQNI